jgi:6-phosphogluconolactonase
VAPTSASSTKPTTNESHQILPDESGKFVFVPCRNDTKHVIFQFAFDDVMGKLIPNSTPTVDSEDPRHIAFLANGKFAYLINENPAILTAFSYDAVKGQLSKVDSKPLATGEDWGSHVVTTPDSKFVYVGGRKTGTIYGYSIDQATGKVTEVTKVSMSIQVPRDFAMSPTGQHLIVANESLKTLTVLKIATDGKLTVAGVPTPSPSSSVTIVPVPKS